VYDVPTKNCELSGMIADIHHCIWSGCIITILSTPVTVNVLYTLVDESITLAVQPTIVLLGDGWDPYNAPYFQLATA
jgi:hypothetical protein